MAEEQRDVMVDAILAWDETLRIAREKEQKRKATLWEKLKADLPTLAAHLEEGLDSDSADPDG